MKPIIFAAAVLAMLPALGADGARAGAAPIVAAENFYGDVAQQIGGPDVAVTSILSNPDADPHLFEASPSVARSLAGARLVIYNGLGYDPWMSRLLRSIGGGNRATIEVAALIGRIPGDNPHIWYAPQTMPALAVEIGAKLGGIEPEHRADFARRAAAFQLSMRPIADEISTMRKQFAGIPVTATEPVFNDMLEALGMQIRNRRFQLAVMNNTEPGASDIAAFETDLRAHRVRLLVYNSQTSGPAARRLVAIARGVGIPVVGASETEPPGMNYHAWIASELDAVAKALAK